MGDGPRVPLRGGVSFWRSVLLNCELAHTGPIAWVPGTQCLHGIRHHAEAFFCV